MKCRYFLQLFIFIFLRSSLIHSQGVQQYSPVNFSQVQITDDFWKPKIDKVATKTLETCIYQTEIKTPRIRNFEKVIRNKGEKHEGIYYDDSDVYKALEAIGYSLQTHPNKELEATADRWIALIAAAQMPDGYLNTYFQLGDINRRWTDIEKHEDYNAGHLIEAAVAYYEATKKTALLNVAVKLANHIDTTMRINQKKWFSGHQEIELALMKLYHLTGNENYLKLADWYLQQRGKNIYTYGGNWIKPDYWQDMASVKNQNEITGHAVRAMYMYTGAADVAEVTGDTGYLHAMKTVWEDVVYRNMYLTGGIGASGDNEGFSKDYDLPNDKAYCETCASVGMVFWNQRMSQLTGESKYFDVLERSLYNGALDGLSLSGTKFFYDNVLASNGDHERSEWFGTACCPANITRLVASLGNYVYGVSDDAVWVHLFVGSNTTVNLGGSSVGVFMQTNYPWNGNISININPEKEKKFKLKIRIPGWLVGNTVPGGLYTQANTIDKPGVTINGQPVNYTEQNGYAVIDRTWKKGDVVLFTMPMHVQQVSSKDQLVYNNNKMALQRGPLVYCVEGIDNSNTVYDIFIPEGTSIVAIPYNVDSEPVIALTVNAKQLVADDAGTQVNILDKKVTAIPYYTWANRGKSEMQVWIPSKITGLKIQ